MASNSPLPLPFLNNGIAQIAMVVKNLEETVEQYHKLFGIDGWTFYTYGKPLVKKMSYHGQPGEHSFRVALSFFGDTRIELIQPLEGGSIYKDFIAQHGYGLQHLGVLVEDMDAALAQARAAGLEMIQDGSGFGLDGDGHYAYLDTEKTLGVTIELIERPRLRHAPEKIYPPE
jgi:catechol 2,3-dioxygenase-like lactoylglutathione lyase family enzyme